METQAYYNTTHLFGSELLTKIKKSLNQEFWVLEIFKRAGKLSASRAHRLVMTLISRYGISEWPLTSTRRAITNLLNKNKLKKTNDFAIGMYGSKEHIYEPLTN